MIELRSVERALLVTIKLNSEKKDHWRIEDMTQELEELTDTCGAKVIDSITCLRDKPTPNLFIGKGKTEEILLICQEEGIDTVVFSHNLSGTQQRNLEAVIGKKTLDRTQLILDIFARHAKSPEGKTQVELAQLQYLLPRLVGKGIALSRLGGGIGTRGPGEQKLEVDRRRIRKRIDKLKNDLKDYFLHRLTLKKRRIEKGVSSVVLVGYTNAGKSTLLNVLTKSNQDVADSLFTTLDPLSKSFVLANGEQIVISDTVGFLHKLPHHLIEAFKATLEEVTEADLLIHVLDASHPRIYEHHQAVSAVLKELQAENKPIITALNKIDLLDDQVWLQRLKDDFPNSVPISAKFIQNLGQLSQEIEKHLVSKMRYLELMLPHSRMDLLDLIYRTGKVKEIEYLSEGVRIKANLPQVLSQKLLRDRSLRWS